MTEEHKKLYRSESNRWLLGVCGGLGEYFDVDPTLIRVLFIVFALVFGGGFLLYLILWLIIPMKPPEIEAIEDTED
jgi:phage shock protein PspC (stress-responsive transcriptional regulator)